MYQYDYKQRNSSSKSKFPLIRIVLFGGLCFLVFKLFFAPAGESPEGEVKEKEAKEEKLEHASQNVKDSLHFRRFTLESGRVQVSLMVDPSGVLPPEADSLDATAQYILNSERILGKAGQYPFRLDFFYPKTDSNAVEPMAFRIQKRGRTVMYRALELPNGYIRWVNSLRCQWNVPCPGSPLEGASIPLPDTFDFQGKEQLLNGDLFLGLGESPVKSILDGKILSVSDTGAPTVQVYHGRNISAVYQGDLQLNSKLSPGMNIQKGFPLARLIPKDSSALYIQVYENGKFKRFDQFRQDKLFPE